MKKIILFSIFLFSHLFVNAGAEKPPPLQMHFKREIPLELFSGNNATFGVNGEGIIECYRGIKLAEIYYFSSDINLINRENGIEIDDENGLITLGLAEVRLKPKYSSAAITFDKKGYRGFIRAIYQDTSQGMQVLDIVDIEDYLKGVLPGEIGHRTEEEYEAVKAQAVAARTYAVWKLTDHETSGKLVSTIADQLYTGMDSEIPMLSKAVDETAGEIAVYKNRPIAAYYHAVCGGYTSPIEKTWPDKKPTPYLVAVDDDSNCAWAKSYAWSEDFTLDILKANLKAFFLSKGEDDTLAFNNIRDIDFLYDAQSGRVDTMKVITERRSYIAAVDRVRWALGRPSVSGAILPSTKFTGEKEMKDGKIVGLKVTGTGNGHGVGMCQCGAIGQARAGQKYEDILQFYYRHIKLARIY